MNLLNLTSSLSISADLPVLNEDPAVILVIGTCRALYNFFLKYSTSAISPRLVPPGRVEISVDFPSSPTGIQKSSRTDKVLESSLSSPVD